MSTPDRSAVFYRKSLGGVAKDSRSRIDKQSPLFTIPSLTPTRSGAVWSGQLSRTWSPRRGRSPTTYQKSATFRQRWPWRTSVTCPEGVSNSKEDSRTRERCQHDEGDLGGGYAGLGLHLAVLASSRSAPVLDVLKPRIPAGVCGQRLAAQRKVSRCPSLDPSGTGSASRLCRPAAGRSALRSSLSLDLAKTTICGACSPWPSLRSAAATSRILRNFAALVVCGYTRLGGGGRYVDGRRRTGSRPGVAIPNEDGLLLAFACARPRVGSLSSGVFYATSLRSLFPDRTTPAQARVVALKTAAGGYQQPPNPFQGRGKSVFYRAFMPAHLYPALGLAPMLPKKQKPPPRRGSLHYGRPPVGTSNRWVSSKP